MKTRATVETRRQKRQQRRKKKKTAKRERETRSIGVCPGFVGEKWERCVCKSDSPYSSVDVCCNHVGEESITGKKHAVKGEKKSLLPALTLHSLAVMCAHFRALSEHIEGPLNSNNKHNGLDLRPDRFAEADSLDYVWAGDGNLTETIERFYPFNRRILREALGWSFPA